MLLSTALFVIFAAVQVQGGLVEDVARLQSLVEQVAALKEEQSDLQSMLKAVQQQNQYLQSVGDDGLTSVLFDDDDNNGGLDGLIRRGVDTKVQARSNLTNSLAVEVGDRINLEIVEVDTQLLLINSMFICPDDGTYVVTVGVIADNNKAVAVGMFLDGIDLGNYYYIESVGQDGYTRSTHSFIVECTPGAVLEWLRVPDSANAGGVQEEVRIFVTIEGFPL